MSDICKKLCVASFIRIVTSCAVKPQRKYNEVCKVILLSVTEGDDADLYYENSKGRSVHYIGENYSKIHHDGQNVPQQIIKSAKDKNYLEVRSYFQANILPLLDESKKRCLVLALLDVIESDKSLPETTEFGFERKYTKAELKNNDTFTLSEFLTDIFLYSLLKTDNSEGRDFAREIRKENYADQFKDKSSKINLLHEDEISFKIHATNTKTKITPIEVPDYPQSTETKYIEALLEAYSDAECVTTISLKSLDDQQYSEYKKHLKRERRNFYAAESLREGTKDLFPEGEIDEFEALKEEIEQGVHYVYIDEYKNNLVRCNHVMTAAGRVQVQSTKTFIDNRWLGTIQKQGVCHFLVNEDRLKGWTGQYE